MKAPRQRSPGLPAAQFRPLVSAVLCALSLLFLACNTLPVGYDQLRDRVTGTADTMLLPDSASGYTRYVPLGGANLLYLGRDAYYRSRLILRFSILDTMSLDSITSFRLVLHQPDTLATMSFFCRPCSSEWVENGASWQMSDSLNHWLSPGGDFLYDTVAAGTMVGDSVMVDLRYVGLDSAKRRAIRDCGIIVFPQDTGIVAIHSGVSTTTAPRLRVTYTNSGKETERIINDIADASLVDTVVTNSSLFDLQVGSGVAFRTWLTFTVESIPTEATIARADLKFKPEMKYRRGDTITVGVYRLTESYTQRGANARYENLPSGYAAYAVPEDGDTFITIDMRSLVQHWVNYPETLWTNHPSPDTAPPDTLRNHGLILAAWPEYSALFRFRVPRSGPSAPRLEIQYVLPPEDRFH